MVGMDLPSSDSDTSLVAETTIIDPKGGCPVCGCELGTDTISCHLCVSPHHTDCWNYNGGCATFGCPEGINQAKAKELARVDTCPVCSRPPTGATVRCRNCENIHHAECWQTNHGCGTVGCSSNPDAALSNPLPEKILLPKLRVGLFRGIYFVPPLTALWCLVMELFSIMLMAGGSPVLAMAAFGAMVTGIIWAAITSERYNFNISLKAITKSKLVGEKEVSHRPDGLGGPSGDAIHLHGCAGQEGAHLPAHSAGTLRW
jgi:hypothetical protein